MNERQQKLLELLDRNLKISTLISYSFRISEITNAIKSINSDLYKQQRYFLELENNRKYKNKIHKKWIKNKKIKKNLTKILNKYLTQIKKISLIINQHKIEPQQLFEKLSELNLFINELIINKNLADAELQYLFTISDQCSEQLKIEEPLDLSLSNKNQRWELREKINISIVNKEHYNDILETHTKDSLFIQKNSSKPSSSFIYANNFNDIQTYLLTEQLEENNFLNDNEKSTYRNTTSEIEK